MDNKNNKSKILNPKYYYILAFALGCVNMYMMLSYSSVLSTGKFCILEGDLLELYVPTLRGACKDLLNGQSIYYSWNHSLGMNMSLPLAFDGFFNPFTFLFLIFNKVDPSLVTAAIIVLKTGLASLSFYLFCKYALEIDDLKTLVFSIAYSMCSFQVTFNVVNFIWMDALYIFPLLILSIYILAYKKNPLLLLFTYSFLFITQFYMGYMVGIISFIFFLLSIFLLDLKESKIIYIVKYILSVIISILLSSFVWLPTLYSLLHQGASDSTPFGLLRLSIIDVYNQLFFSNNGNNYSGLPNIYCGIFTLILFPVAFYGIKKNKKEMLLMGIPLIFLLLSCIVKPLYIFIHAFDAPDGWEFRFSWMISFFVCVFALRATDSIHKIKNLYFYLIAIINCLIYVVQMIIQSLKNKTDYITNSWLYFVINLIIIFIWVLVICYFKKIKPERQYSFWLLCILLISFECIGNGYLAFYKNEDGKPGQNEYSYNSFLDNLKYVSDKIDLNKEFYRINHIGGIMINSDSFGGFNGVSDFSTSENPNVRFVLSKLGLATSPREVYSNGLTEITKKILSIKYDIIEYDASLLNSFEQVPDIIENDYLNIGYMVNDNIRNVSFCDDSFENNNLLISSMLGEKVDVYSPIDINDFEIVSSGLEMDIESSDYITFKSTSDLYNDTITLLTDNVDSDLYMYIINDFSRELPDSMIIIGDEEELSVCNGNISMSYIKKFDNYGDILSVTILSDGRKEQTVQGIRFAKMNHETLDKAYDELSENQMEIIDFSNGKIVGKVCTNDSKNILFTTIPYDKCWEIKVNGEPKDYIPLLDGAFIGIELPENGEYVIDMKYHVGWLKEGCIVSSGTLFILLIYLVVFLLKRNTRIITTNNSSISF